MTRPLPGQLSLLNVPIDDAARFQRHVERVTQHHSAHAISGRAHRDCLACQADPPAPRVLPHPFGALPTKWRTAAHLEFAHGDRSLHHNVSLRPAAEFERLHRELHDAMTAGT